jgi:hypothetical protein
MTGRCRHILRAAGLAVLMLCVSPAQAHEFTLDAVMNAFVKVEQNEVHLVIRAPLYLFKAMRFPVKGIEVDVDNSASALERALTALQQDVVILENGHALKASRASGRLSLPSDRSFQSYDLAAEHVATAVEPGTSIVIDQGYVDAHLIYPIASLNDVFSLRTMVGRELGLKVTVRFIGPSGESRALLIRSGSGGVDLNPTVFGAASGFVGLGISHIVTGFDHLLFVLCLLIPVRGVRQLLAIVTGFTLAHSFTLIGSAFGLAPQGPWFAPLVEVIIALSIVYMAVENMVGVDLRRRVLLAILFGLVHGFAFSQGLKEELQFAGSHLLVALFAFNIGIEIGQLIALTVMLPVLVLVTRHVLTGRVGSIILSALIAHVGWHWMTDRWDALSRVRWPSLDAANVTTLLFWAGALVLLATGVRAAVTRLRLETVPPAHR